MNQALVPFLEEHPSPHCLGKPLTLYLSTEVGLAGPNPTLCGVPLPWTKLPSRDGRGVEWGENAKCGHWMSQILQETPHGGVPTPRQGIPWERGTRARASQGKGGGAQVATAGRWGWGRPW